jgi:tRNA threonylcarbamoyladenosine modification (KEOPS) complex  Pcc1 subunit
MGELEKLQMNVLLKRINIQIKEDAKIVYECIKLDTRTVHEIQKKYNMGYNKARRILDKVEEYGDIAR